MILESGSPHSLLALVEGGHGIAILPSTVQLLNLRQRAIALHREGRQLGVRMSAIWDPRRSLSPAATIFVDEVYRSTRRDYPGKAFRLGELVDSSTTLTA